MEDDQLIRGRARKYTPKQNHSLGFYGGGGKPPNKKPTELSSGQCIERQNHLQACGCRMVKVPQLKYAACRQM